MAKARFRAWTAVQAGLHSRRVQPRARFLKRPNCFELCCSKTFDQDGHCRMSMGFRVRWVHECRCAFMYSCHESVRGYLRVLVCMHVLSLCGASH